MGRPPEVDAHTLASELQAAARRDGDRRPVMTVSDLADALKVSDQSVRNQIDELEEVAGVHTDRIDRAQVFWYSGRDAVSEGKLDPLEVFDLQHAVWENAVTTRAVYLGLRRQMLSEHGRRDVSAAVRLGVLEAMNDYLQAATFGRVAVGLTDDRDDYTLPEEAKLSDTDVTRYLEDVHLFSDEKRGEVTGLHELVKISWEITLAATDEHGFASVDNIPQGELEEMVPEVDALLAAGDIVDRFVNELYGEGWW